jgi:hypothetical protein
MQTGRPAQTDGVPGGSRYDITHCGTSVSGVAKFSANAVNLRSSPTVFADTRIFGSTSTGILSGRPPRAIWSAAMLLHAPFVRHASERGHETLEGVPDNKLSRVPNALGWRLGPSNSAILPRASRDKKRHTARAAPSVAAQASEHLAHAMNAPRRTSRTRGPVNIFEAVPVAHSMASSARASNVGGTSMPSALAVLRSISSSNFVA